MTEHWFNQKYRNGGRPTLADKIELVREEMRFQVSERVLVDLKGKLFEVLNEFDREYDPRTHHNAYTLVAVIGPAVGLDVSKALDRYNRILKKHEGKVQLASNFSS